MTIAIKTDVTIKTVAAIKVNEAFLLNDIAYYKINETDFIELTKVKDTVAMQIIQLPTDKIPHTENVSLISRIELAVYI